MSRPSGAWSDPGWPPRVWRGLIPLWMRFALGRRQQPGGLLALRTVYVSLASSPLYLFVLLVLLSRGGGDAAGSAVLAAVITFVGAAAVAIASIVVRGRDVPLDADHVVGAFRVVFFIRFALADAAAVLAFVMYFLAGSRLWIYLIGMVWSLVAFAFLAPTKRSIDDWDRPRRRGQPRPPLGELLTERD